MQLPTPLPQAPVEKEFPLETGGFDACEFNLSNGKVAKVVFARFRERRTDRDPSEGPPPRPSQHCGIKVYCTDGTPDGRMALHWEYRAGTDFIMLAVPRIWEWLAGVADRGEGAKYDSVDDFLDDLTEQIQLISDAGEDAVEHIERLPELSVPEAFDHEDDSIYNDQNEPTEPPEPTESNC
jgi:hypothetical protein